MIIIPQHIEALIFDLDGTLADTMPLHIDSWIRTGQHFNVPITASLIVENSGTPTFQLVETFNAQFGWQLDAQEVKKEKQKHFDAIKKAHGKVKAIPTIYEVAKNMRGVLPMSIGTGSSRGNAEKSLADMGMVDWWITVVTGSDQVKGKPAPDIFLECAKRMNVAPENCLVFEDGAAGIKAAKAANMSYIDVKLLEQS